MSLGFEDEFGVDYAEMNSEYIYKYSARLNRNGQVIKIICFKWICISCGNHTERHFILFLGIFAVESVVHEIGAEILL